MERAGDITLLDHLQNSANPAHFPPIVWPYGHSTLEINFTIQFRFQTTASEYQSSGLQRASIQLHSITEEEVWRKTDESIKWERLEDLTKHLNPKTLAIKYLSRKELTTNMTSHIQSKPCQAKSFKFPVLGPSSRNATTHNESNDFSLPSQEYL